MNTHFALAGGRRQSSADELFRSGHLCLSQTATTVAILDAGDLVQRWRKALIFTQRIDLKANRQAGTLRVLLIADVSLASVSGAPPTAETIKTISHKNKKAPCEVRR
ncbi:hypothetical protein [Pseudomonas fluorescens]|uniref:hypothetical protein n=1 Tax=Pseudomonas fluorescens TaxID=294 RepID=UPI00163AF421|nr:hypothetical protein [Pseudomonas fluorescens]